MLTTCLSSIQLPLQESINAPLVPPTPLNAAQILLFVQENLDQSEVVTRNHKYKFVNKCRKPETQACIPYSFMHDAEGRHPVQPKPVQYFLWRPPGSPSCPGTPWQPCMWCQSKTHWIVHKHTGMGRAAPPLCTIAKIEKVFYQAFFFFSFSCQFFGKEWCFIRLFLKALKSKTRTYLYALGYFFDFTSW